MDTLKQRTECVVNCYFYNIRRRIKQHYALRAPQRMRYKKSRDLYILLLQYTKVYMLYDMYMLSV